MDIDTKRHSVSRLVRKLKRANLCRVKIRIHRSLLKLKLKLYTHDGSTRDVITSLPLNPPEYSVVVSDEKSESEFEDDELFDHCDDKGTCAECTTTVAMVARLAPLISQSTETVRRSRSASPSPSYVAATTDHVPIYAAATKGKPSREFCNNSFTTNSIRNTRNKSVSPVRDGRPLILFKSQVNGSVLPTRKSASPEPRGGTGERSIRQSVCNRDALQPRVSSRTVKFLTQQEHTVLREQEWFQRVQLGVVIYLLYVLLR